MSAVRVTVVGETRRVDVTIPPVPISEAMSELVKLVGRGAGIDDVSPQRWTLTRLDGVPLDPEQSLAAAGILEGELLYLGREGDANEPAIVQDFDEAVAIIVHASSGQWRPRHLRVLLYCFGALGLGAGAVAWLPFSGAGTPPGSALVLGTALVLMVAAGLLSRPLGRAGAGAAVALGALPWFAAGAGQLAVLSFGADPTLRWSAAGAGVAVGALAAWAAAPVAFGPAAAVLLAATPLAAGGAAIGLGRATPEQAAVALVVLLSAELGLLPAAAARATGLLAADHGDFPQPALEADVRRARRLLGWLLVGAGVALAASLALLAFSADDWIARSLCIAVVLAVALRARQHRFLAEVLPLATWAVAGAALLATGLLLPAPAPARTIAALAAGAAMVAAGALVPEGRLDPQVRRWLGYLELAVNAALVPLALWDLGVYGALNAWAHHI